MYLLDSSAWLAHLLGESGMEEVTALFAKEETVISISALSLPEVYTRLKALGQETRWSIVWATYQPLFTQILAVDVTIAQTAIHLRTITPQRLPTIDCLIAATAAVHGLILVHRDPHLAAIPTGVLKQIKLPEK
ncbi:MAG: type II toxin-antitoxin system VapC family toxin [Caldilineaceae bacterium]